jgi:hypothetical protein
MRWISAVAATLAVAACLVGGVLLFVWHEQQHPHEPNLQPLTNSLKERMDDLLGSSNLANSTIQLSVAKSQLESEVARVKYLAIRLGGSAAIKEPVGGPTTDLIAEIPVENRKSFIDAVMDGFKDLPQASPAASPTMCVVSVQISVQS